MKISELTATAEFRNTAERIQVDLISAVPLEKAIEKTLINFETQIENVDLEKILSEKKSALSEKNFGVLLVQLFDREYKKLIELLKVEGEIQKLANQFIYELTARTALYAQPLVGVIAKSALDKMSADQLNEMVYGKAEDEFVWIRMNGSIVGALIGLIIFCLIKVAGF